MLILHAAQIRQNLVLWAEDSDPGLEASGHLIPGDHPRCAGAQLLAKAAGLGTGDNRFDSAVAWLPSRGDVPVPSSALAGPIPRSRAKPRIRPWTVAMLRPNPEQTVRLLRACHGQRVLKPGVVIGPDLAYWAEALRLALSMTARQQFLPTLSQRDGQTIATWTPVFTGEDAQRLAQLAGLMPTSARALTVTDGTEPPAMAAQAVLREFITAQVDHLARAGTESRRPEHLEANSAHDAWLSALTHPDPTVRGNQAQLQQLRRQVAEWQRPIAIAANSPYRLCLRLEEPPEPGPDDEAQAIRQEDWYLRYLRYLLQPHDDHSLLLPAESVWKNQLNGTHTGLQRRRVPAEFPGPGRRGLSVDHRQPAKQTPLGKAPGHRGGPRLPGKTGRRAATGRIRRAAARMVDPPGHQDQAQHPGQGQNPGHAGRLRHLHDLPHRPRHRHRPGRHPNLS